MIVKAFGLRIVIDFFSVECDMVIIVYVIDMLVFFMKHPMHLCWFWFKRLGFT